MEAIRLTSFTAGPIDGEIQAILAADIAVEYIPDVKTQIDRRNGSLLGASAGIQELEALLQTRLSAQGATTGVSGIVRLEDRQYAVTDQLQHVAAGLVDRRDDRIRVVVEQRDDLIGRRRIGDGGVVAQVREPQDRADAIGNAARDTSAENALSGIVAEIDLHQRSGDPCQGRAFDGKRELRNENAQGLDFGCVEPFGAARRPVRIEAIHFADHAVAGESVDKGEVIGVALVPKIVEVVKLGELSPVQATAELLSAGRQQMVEDTALPVRRQGAAVFHDRFFVHAIVAPPEGAALIGGMKRVDDGHAPGQVDVPLHDIFRKTRSAAPFPRLRRDRDWITQAESLLQVACVHCPILADARAEIQP